MSAAREQPLQLLRPDSTIAIVFGAHDWTEAGLTRAPSFLRSARRIVRYLYDSQGLALDPELVIDLFDDPSSAADQLSRIRDTLDSLIRDRRDEGRPVADLLIYYIGHGHPDDVGGLSLLVKRSRSGIETETSIRAIDLARVLRSAAPTQRRAVILDCCFSERAASSFIGMSPDLNIQVACMAGNDLVPEPARRGTIILCSSPVGRASIGAPNAETTLFTGAVLDVLQKGIERHQHHISFSDLRDAAYEKMLERFGATTPRPALHQPNQEQGDLTRVPAFANRGFVPRQELAPTPSAALSIPEIVSVPTNRGDEMEVREEVVEGGAENQQQFAQGSDSSASDVASLITNIPIEQCIVTSLADTGALGAIHAFNNSTSVSSAEPTNTKIKRYTGAWTAFGAWAVASLSAIVVVFLFSTDISTRLPQVFNELPAWQLVTTEQPKSLASSSPGTSNSSTTPPVVEGRTRITTFEAAIADSKIDLTHDDQTCTKLSAARSASPLAKSSSMHISNYTSDDFTLYWIGFDGKIAEFQSLPRYKTADQLGYIGYAWMIVTKTGVCRNIFTSDATFVRVEIY